jgi:SAM-dependent methyltransferase
MTLNPKSNAVRRSKTEPRLRGTDLVLPSLRDPAYLDNRRRVELVAEEAAKLPPQAGRMLDVGGKGKPYACSFAGRAVNRHFLDVEPALSVDVAGDARIMPFSDASMDVVLATQVLEHIPDPIAAIGEIRRVLKPGGTLLLSVPSIFPQHGSPGDYWRYMWSTCICKCSPVRGRGWKDWSSGRFCPVNNLIGLLRKTYRGNQSATNYFVVAVR